MSDRRLDCQRRRRLAQQVEPTEGGRLGRATERNDHVLPKRTVTMHVVLPGNRLWEIQVNHWEDSDNIVADTIKATIDLLASEAA